jgi:hypothetical protein
MAAFRRKTAVSAVHEDDARAFLESIGIAGAYDDGSLACSCCGRSLKSAGLGAVRRHDGEFVFACELLDCIRTVSGQEAA